MDEAQLRRLVDDLLSGDRERTRAAIDAHLADDVSFSHILGKFQGKESVYGVYRLAGSAWNYKVKWLEYIRSGNTVVLQLDLGIKVPPFYVWRYHFPTIVLLRFAPDPKTGAPKLIEQVDHHSLLVALWLLGWPFTVVSEALWRPLTGFVFSRLGWALDALDDVRGAVQDAVLRVLPRSAPGLVATAPERLAAAANGKAD